ncbi:MAG TPA: hypothetical protein VIU61_04730 [Kofleriaceae bacterium]
MDWNRLPRARRAAVYRAIGRAGRFAREDRKPELAADLRIAMAVLRGQFSPKARPVKRKPKAKPKRKR